MATTNPTATDSAAELRNKIGNDSTATFEDDPTFVDSNPGAEGSSENLPEQRMLAASDEDDEDEDEEDDFDEDEDEDDVDEDEDFDDEEDDEEYEDDEDEEDAYDHDDDPEELEAAPALSAVEDNQNELDDDAGDLDMGIDEDDLDGDDIDTDRIVATLPWRQQPGVFALNSSEVLN